VQTESSAITNVMDSQQISDIPLNGRLATQLVLLSGASVGAPAGDEVGSKSFYSSVAISVAGGQANGTNYLLDGGDNNDTFANVNLPFPFPDAIQEFSVETSALPARNGLHPGGVVNIVTKSGTNQLHGDLFDFYRDGAFNAPSRSFTPTANKPDTLVRNQFGGTIGGKIIADKLFFFAGYQATRQHSVALASTHTATAAALAGDFTTLESKTCVSAGARTLGGGFTGNMISPTKYDPAAVKLFTAGYVPTSSDPCGLLSYSIPAIDNDDQIIGRIDWIQSQKNALYGRYFVDNFRAPAPFNISNLIITQTPGNLERAQSFTLGDTYTFTSSLINSFHATLNRRRDNRGPDPRDINATTLGTNMFVQIPDFLLVNLSGYFMVGCGTCAPGFFNVNTLQAADDVDWIRGNHHFAFGADFIRTQNNTLSGYDENGTFSFTGTVTKDGLADFLLGDQAGFSQSRAQKVAYRENIPSIYAQDTYKVTSRVTVTAGLRWEPTLWPSDVFHRGSIFNMNDFLNNVHSGVYPGAPAGMLYYGDPGVPAAYTNPHWLNFAPRIGVAWDPTGKGTQSLRAGYGIFYDSTMAWFTQRLTSNPPTVNQIDTTTGCGTFSNPYLNYSLASGCGTANANQNPFPGGTISFPGNSFWVSLPPNMRPTYMMQWDLSYEREFLHDWSFSLAYLGNRTLHLPLSYDLNAPVNSSAVCAQFTTGCTTGNVPQRRSLVQTVGATAPQNASAIGVLDYADDTGFSNYNGMLATLKHRFSQNFNLQANYTYSHCLSVGDFNGDLRGAYYMIQNDPGFDYGNCNFDIRHNFNASLVALSPFRGHGAVKWLLGGWQVVPAFRAVTGFPLNITLGTDSLATFEGNDRPELVPGQPLYINKWEQCGANQCYQVFNPAAFANPTSASAPFPIVAKNGNPYPYPAVGRDALRAPGVFNFDTSVSRLFPITERVKFEFRFDAFNVLNHFNPKLGDPGTTQSLNSSNFGRITAAPTAGYLPSQWDPRVLQFAVKLHW
ncbi:MAG: carboxypeptidase regulatory-like domain-containing protein, partial [Terriglobales bacterium]